MEEIKGQYYLTSTEHYGFEIPRLCKILGRLKNQKGKDFLLIHIDPPIIGQTYGLGDKDIDKILIAARHVRVKLFPIKEFPVYVHICRIINEKIIDTGKLSENDIENIAWGDIYATYEDAKKAAENFMRMNKDYYKIKGVDAGN